MRRPRTACAPGRQRRCHLLRSVVAGVDRRLRRGPEPRPADLRDGAVLLRADGRRLPQAPPRDHPRPRGVRRGRRRRSRRWPTPRASTPTPSPSGSADPPAEGRVVSRPSVRGDIALMDGYHSPQLDVAVRLNTNEAPEPPPEEFVAWRCGRRWPTWTGTAIPIDPPTGCVRDRRDRSATRCPAGVDAGQRVRGQRIERGAPVPVPGVRGCRAVGADLRADLRPAHPHRPASPGPAPSRSTVTDDFTLDPGTAAEAIRRERPILTFLCSPNNPTGRVEPPDLVEAVLDAVDDGRRAARRRRGVRPVLGGRRPSASSPRTDRSWSPAPTPRRGRRRRCDSAT